MPARTISLTFDPDLAGRLEAASSTTGLSHADLIVRCVRNHLDGVVSYDRVTDELGLVKDALLELSGLVGQVLAEPDERAVGEFCRYKPPKVGRPA
jgi:hypothetical protein